MAQIVCPGVCRYAVHGKNDGRVWTNIFDVDIGDISATRYQTIQAKAVQILDAFVARYRSLLGTITSIESVSWVDLNSANGATGVISTTPTNTLPLSGTGGVAATANVAVYGKKVTVSTRSTRNGRTYFAGIGLTQTLSNKLTSGGLTLWQTACNGMLSDLNAVVAGFSCAFEVVGRDAGGTISKHPVQAYTVQSVLATQRQRLRG